MKLSERCTATTLKGTRCKKKKCNGSECCTIHSATYTRPEGPTCSICLTTVTKKTTLTNCGHTFCEDCIYEWMTTSEDNIMKDHCPMCRRKPPSRKPSRPTVGVWKRVSSLLCSTNSITTAPCTRT